VVFVDTASGQPISATTSDADLAAVTLGAGASSRSSGVVRRVDHRERKPVDRWQRVLEGLAFAADRFSQTGTAQILGRRHGRARAQHRTSRIEAVR